MTGFYFRPSPKSAWLCSSLFPLSLSRWPFLVVFFFFLFFSPFFSLHFHFPFLAWESFGLAKEYGCAESVLSQIRNRASSCLGARRALGDQGIKVVVRG